MAGIYTIVNLTDGTQYIGQTINLTKREKTHFRLLEKNGHPNVHLQRAYIRDGRTAFDFRVLETVSEECLTAQEQYWYDRCKQLGIPTYNFSEFVKSPMRGRTHTEETKQKYFIGHKPSEATRKKLSELYSGSRNPFYGKTHSEKTLSALRAPKSLETRALWSAQRKGRKLTEEWKANIREACKGINTKSHCPKGHLRTPENSYSKSTCKTCAKAASKRATARKREAKRVAKYGVQ